jgi:hypothetical protein
VSNDQLPFNSKDHQSQFIHEISFLAPKKQMTMRAPPFVKLPLNDTIPQGGKKNQDSISH